MGAMNDRLPVIGLAVVVLQIPVPLDGTAVLGAPRAHLLRGLARAAELLAVVAGFKQPLPQVFVRRRKQASTENLVIPVPFEPGQRAPAQNRKAVVRMFKRCARAAVGIEPCAQHEFLQGKFLHIHQNRRGLRVGLVTSVEHHRCACVIAAVQQLLLSVQQVALAVFGSRRQTRQPLRNDGVVPLRTLHLHGAVTEHWPRVVQHLQMGAAGIGIDDGLAVGQPSGRKTLGLQRLERLRLGLVPGRLGKSRSHRQTPARLNLRQLRCGGHIVFGCTLYLQIKCRNACARARFDGDDHLGSATGLHQVCRQHLIDLRCEISLRGQ